jgi:hypothetical protein
MTVNVTLADFQTTQFPPLYNRKNTFLLTIEWE